MRQVRSPIVLPVILAILVPSAMLTGCGRPHLMPTPVVFEDTGIDPLAERGADDAQATTSRVYYATDRTPRAQPSTPERTYTDERDYGLRVGTATVDLGPGMDRDELDAISLRERRRPNPTPALVSVDEVGPLWTQIPPLQADDVEDPTTAESFAGLVQADLDASSLDEIFVFVHGFNTLFEDNCVIAAELHHYLGEEGVFMSYAWPSRGSLFKYAADKESARYSIRYFRLFLIYLAENTTARRINIIAHSAGAPVAVGAIQQLCLMHFDESTQEVQSRYRLGRLLLVAPDIDLGVFENAVHDQIISVPEHLSIYFSTRDKALDFSMWINGFARLGEPLTELTENDLTFLRDHPEVELIDVALAEKKHGTWLGHSYFHENPWVSSDVILSLRHAAAAADRGLVRNGENPIWEFSSDYDTKSIESARRMYEADGDE